MLRRSAFLPVQKVEQGPLIRSLKPVPWPPDVLLVSGSYALPRSDPPEERTTNDED